MQESSTHPPATGSAVHADPAERDPAVRAGALEQLDAWLRTPMLWLSFAWLALVVYELAIGPGRLVETFGTAIWAVFIVEFAVRFALAPAKGLFLRRNWLTVLALVVPAFRLLRALRAFRVLGALRGLRLVRIVTTANRSMNALRVAMRRRRLGYVIALTLLVAVLGAAGMLAFEPAHQVEGGFTSYADALWWTGMLLTTMGSAFWPVTPEGRILCFLLSLYGFAVFGYITASFASFFVGRDAGKVPAAEPPRDAGAAVPAEPR